MSRCIAYLRVSTATQKESLAAQRQAILAWAKTHGKVITEWFEEVISGKLEMHQRPQLVAAVGELKKGDTLVVWRRDRLARNIVTAAIVERLAGAQGASIIATDGGDFGDGPEGRLLRTIVDAIAEYERMLIIARTRAALAAKKARRELTGTPPYGYEVHIIGTPDKDGKGVIKKLVPCVSEQITAQRIIDLRKGGMAHAKICDALTAEGRFTRSGKPFAVMQVQRVLMTAGMVAVGSRSGRTSRRKTPTGRPPGRPKGSKNKTKSVRRRKVSQSDLPSE
jgi:site-specific DNA recombinase